MKALLLLSTLFAYSVAQGTPPTDTTLKLACDATTTNNANDYNFIIITSAEGLNARQYRAKCNMQKAYLVTTVTASEKVAKIVTDELHLTVPSGSTTIFLSAGDDSGTGGTEVKGAMVATNKLMRVLLSTDADVNGKIQVLADEPADGKGVLYIDCKSHAGKSSAAITITANAKTLSPITCSAALATPLTLAGDASTNIVTLIDVVGGIIGLEVTHAAKVEIQADKGMSVYNVGAPPSHTSVVLAASGKCNDDALTCETQFGTASAPMVLVIAGPTPTPTPVPVPVPAPVKCTYTCTALGGAAGTYCPTDASKRECIGSAIATVVECGASTAGTLLCVAPPSSVNLGSLASALAQLPPAQADAVLRSLIAAKVGVATSNTCAACTVVQLAGGQAMCSKCASSTRELRQGNGRRAVVCNGATDEAQRACFRAAVAAGVLPSDATCYVSGAQVTCSFPAPAAPDDDDEIVPFFVAPKSESKKGLWGLLGLLALIPSLLLICCSVIAFICWRRRRAKQPVAAFAPMPVHHVDEYPPVVDHCPPPHCDDAYVHHGSSHVDAYNSGY